MNALSSVFPTLTGKATDGQHAGIAGRSGKAEPGAADSSFAATLFQLLGGRSELEARPSGGVAMEGGEAPGAVPMDPGGNTPEPSTGGTPQEEGASSFEGASDPRAGRGKSAEPGPGFAEPVGERGVGEIGGAFPAGKSADHASGTGLRNRAEHGVPFSAGMPAGAQTGPDGRSVQGLNRSGGGEGGKEIPLRAADGSRVAVGVSIPHSRLPEEEFGHPASGTTLRTAPGDGGKTIDPSRLRSPAEAESRRLRSSAGVAAPGGRDLTADAAPADEEAFGESLGVTGATEEPGGGSMDPEPTRASGRSAVGKTTPAAPVEAASAHVVNRNPDELNPELRTRLARVITRMESEYGHRVELTEGYRSQERQDALYAQGRTRPGSVVTWTRDSLHSQGRAADLRVDGSWENPKGYARLQRIAGEEGLKTLGARDPGHVELPEAGDPEGASRVRRTPEYWNDPRVARVARVARVSRPASVASTARVARVALPGQAGSSGRSEIGATAEASFQQSDVAEGRSSRVEAGPRPQAPWQAAPDQRIQAASPSDPQASDRELAIQVAEAKVDDRLENASADSASGSTGSPSTAPRGSSQGQMASQSMTLDSGPQVQNLQGTAGPAAPGTTARIDEIQALEEALNARAPGRFHLELDDADGLGTRLRLALRGSQLAGTVDVSDPIASERMRSRIGELHEALTRRGLDARSLAVQGLRGGETGGQADLGTLLQDPLTGLTRILEAREGHSQGRPGREDQQRQDDQGEAGGFDHSARQDREREERR